MSLFSLPSTNGATAANPFISKLFNPTHPLGVTPPKPKTTKTVKELDKITYCGFDLDRLPQVALRRVVSKFSQKEVLQSIALVSRRFADLTQAPEFHHSVVFHGASKAIPPAIFGSIKAYLKAHPTSVSTIKMTDIGPFNQRASKVAYESQGLFFRHLLPQSLPALIELNLDSSDWIEDLDIQTAVVKCPNVTRINLDSHEVNIVDATLTQAIIPKWAPALTHVVLHRCFELNDTALIALLTAIPKNQLIELSIFYFIDILEAPLTVMDNFTRCLFSRVGPALNRLAFEGRYLYDRDINTLAKATPNLSHLTLYGADQLTDASLDIIRLRWRSMTKLHLFSAPFTPAALVSFLTGIRGQLSQISFGMMPTMTDDVARAIADTQPQLELLDLVRCTGFTQDGFEVILRTMTNLRVLVIGESGFESSTLRPGMLPVVELLDVRDCENVVADQDDFVDWRLMDDEKPPKNIGDYEAFLREDNPGLDKMGKSIGRLTPERSVALPSLAKGATSLCGAPGSLKVAGPTDANEDATKATGDDLQSGVEHIAADVSNCADPSVSPKHITAAAVEHDGGRRIPRSRDVVVMIDDRHDAIVFLETHTRECRRRDAERTQAEPERTKADRTEAERAESESKNGACDEGGVEADGRDDCECDSDCEFGIYDLDHEESRVKVWRRKEQLFERLGAYTSDLYWW